MNNVSPETRIIALDYGKRRIGVAVTDALGITAQPHPTLIVKNNADAINQIKDLTMNYDSVRIVLGLPRSLSGKIGKAGETVQEFGTLLRDRLPRVRGVDYFDERFTTKEAERAMRAMNEKPSRNKAKVDSISAVLILQGYLETQISLNG